MNLLKNAVGFVAVLGCISAASAATSRGESSRVSYISGRMPAINIRNSSGGSTAQPSGNSSVLPDKKCLDSYISCVKGGEVCGPNFEYCTTKTLFHAKMPQCFSTLAQCSSAGINSLFGTGAVNNLSKNDGSEEDPNYVYPSDGSVLGQMIDSALAANRYTTAGECVKYYTRCLQHDDVCGEDFELCTTSDDFKKQMILCDSTLARCTLEGKQELFGSNYKGKDYTDYGKEGRIKQLIDDGLVLAATNAVSTCYKTIDNCIRAACTKNPLRCKAGSSAHLVALVDQVKNPIMPKKASTSVGPVSDISEMAERVDLDFTMDKPDTKGSDVNKYISENCEKQIGTNKFCFLTAKGHMPTPAELNNPNTPEDVFNEIYDDRKETSKAIIDDLVNKFDTRTKTSCAGAIQQCALSVCGDGIGPVCYSRVFKSGGNSAGGDKYYSGTMKILAGKVDSINGPDTWSEIKRGCEAVINTNPSCIYAYKSIGSHGNYDYEYMDEKAFDALFPPYSDDGKDPIGVVAHTNATLASMYNDAAIEELGKECEKVAKKCIVKNCGNDYENCYRNRTDITSNVTKISDLPKLEKSMNKVGGVLDYTIILGLCLDDVKDNSSCKAHLKIERFKSKTGGNPWGSAADVREGWFNAGSRNFTFTGEEFCTNADGIGEGICNKNECGENGDELCSVPVPGYGEEEAAKQLFSRVIFDLEKKVQAIYNAKLTQEQNACIAAGREMGGILGMNDLSGTYMWAKLRKSKVPTYYATEGLQSTEFTASNDLYGSFCRVRITLQSDDKDIQEAIAKATWANAYFAVGDTFVCGSWIPRDELQKISQEVADRELGIEHYSAHNGAIKPTTSQNKTRAWITALTSVGGAVGGGFLGNSLGNKLYDNALGFGKDNDTITATYINQAINATDQAMTNANNITDKNAAEDEGKMYAATVKNWAEQAKSYVTQATNKVRKEKKSGKKKEWSIPLSSADSANEAAGALVAAAGRLVDNLSTDNAKAAASAAATLKSQLETLKTDADIRDEQIRNKKLPGLAGTIVGAGVLATAAGVITNQAMKDAQVAKLTKEEKEAIDQWMDDVGSHISCYIGSEEAGNYGDTQTIELP